MTRVLVSEAPAIVHAKEVADLHSVKHDHDTGDEAATTLTGTQALVHNSPTGTHASLWDLLGCNDVESELHDGRIVNRTRACDNREGVV